MAMKIENKLTDFIVYFSEKEKQTGIIEALKEKLPMLAFFASEDGSQFHINNGQRDSFNRIVHKYLRDKQLSLF